jgi:hypothetical protein
VKELKNLLEDLADLGISSVNPLSLVDYDEIEYNLDELEQTFQQRLQTLGYDNIQVSILNFDPDTGDLLVRFINPDNNEQVDVLFTVIDEGILAVVVSEDDEPIEVNLSNLNVPLADYVLQSGIDWDEPLTWLTKSVLSALLEAGRLLESYSPVLGKRKVKLPLIRKGVSELAKHNLKRVMTRKCNRKGKLRKRRKK